MSTFDNKPKALKLSTHLVHSPAVGPEGYNSLATPVYRGSSTFFLNTAAQRAQVDVLGLDYSYGLHGNPTQYTLAKKLAEIEGAKHALVCASGLAAIALVVKACLKQGEHWLLPENAYGPVRLLAEDLLSFGIEYSEYDPCDLSSLAKQLRPNTRLVWAEAPGSLTFEVPDLKSIVQLTQSQNIRTAIDNTWSAGIALKPFELGFDYSVQALTKYQNGHADVLMGAVLSNNTEHFAAVEHKNRRLRTRFARFTHPAPALPAPRRQSLRDCPSPASISRRFKGLAPSLTQLPWAHAFQSTLPRPSQRVCSGAACPIHRRPSLRHCRCPQTVPNCLFVGRP
jgi:cysteine-S-conjugate beta-lyase